jgi:hypothetical protein
LLVERFAAPESDAEPALVVPLSDAEARRATTERAKKDRAESSDE